jgi:hypothetical protein
MAFADPQSITVNSVAISLPRTGLDPVGSFASADGTMVETIAHTNSKNNRVRRQLRFDYSKIAADPLISAQNIKYSMSAYLVVDVPVTGFTVAEAKLLLDGMMTYLTASSGSKLTQFLGGEK